MSQAAKSWLKIAKVQTAQVSYFPLLSHEHGLITYIFTFLLTEQNSGGKLFFFIFFFFTFFFFWGGVGQCCYNAPIGGKDLFWFEWCAPVRLSVCAGLIEEQLFIGTVHAEAFALLVQLPSKYDLEGMSIKPTSNVQAENGSKQKCTNSNRAECRPFQACYRKANGTKQEGKSRMSQDSLRKAQTDMCLRSISTFSYSCECTVLDLLDQVKWADSSIQFFDRLGRRGDTMDDSAEIPFRFCPIFDSLQWTLPLPTTSPSPLPHPSEALKNDFREAVVDGEFPSLNSCQKRL